MAPGDEHDLELHDPLGRVARSSHGDPLSQGQRRPRRPRRRPRSSRANRNWSVPAPTACSSLVGTAAGECVQAAEKLAEEGVELAVINARFVKPLDTRAILQAVREQPFVLTVEEGCLMGGFGSAVLEAANAAGLETSHIRRLGIPDRFVEHADRAELLADLGLSSTGIAETCRTAWLDSAAAQGARCEVSAGRSPLRDSCDRTVRLQNRSPSALIRPAAPRHLLSSGQRAHFLERDPTAPAP